MVCLEGGGPGDGGGRPRDRLPVGDAPFCKGALRGEGLRFFLAARAGQMVVTSCEREIKHPLLSRQVLVTRVTASQNESSGKPSNLKELSKATISDSVEEWETTVCFLQTAFNGKKVLGPTNAAKMPVVLLEVEVQSAKDASENNMMQSLSAVSPIQPCRQ